MIGIKLPDDRPLLIDGGMGECLAQMGMNQKGSPFWSGKALMDAPDTVQQLHQDFICAGANLIITNTYGVVRSFMRKLELDDRFAELNRIAGDLACNARLAERDDVFIAGSLPPLSASYSPDKVEPEDILIELYSEQSEILSPYVDLFIAETLTTIAETRAAAKAATATGKPVWIGWSMLETGVGLLKGGATVKEAAESVQDLPVQAFLANCSTPEATFRAIPDLVATGRVAGAYANTFEAIHAVGINIARRHDLDPDAYANFAKDWIDAGARVVGGCCGTRPEHIARIRQLIEATH